MTGQIPPYSSFSDLDKWGMYEPPPPAPSCPACGESTTYRSEHYVSALGHLSDPEDAIEPYYQCRPGLSAHEATRRARASSGVRDGV